MSARLGTYLYINESPRARVCYAVFLVLYYLDYMQQESLSYRAAKTMYRTFWMAKKRTSPAQLRARYSGDGS